MEAGRPGYRDLAVGVLNSGVGGDGGVSAALGSLPLWGGATSVMVAALVCALRWSTETTVVLPMMSRLKSLGPLSSTL